MAFIIQNGKDLSSIQALEYFDAAINYLYKSKMARSIIEALRDLPDRITVNIDIGLVDKFVHKANIIEWDPKCTIPVIDKAKSRPQVPWVYDATRRYGFLKLKKQRIDVEGEISPMVALLHEMGHAYQYPHSDKSLYLAALKSKESAEPIEDNVVAIENVVILELRERGCNEGIRWDYFHAR